MDSVLVFRMLKGTKHFNANQKVYVPNPTGALAGEAVGKFKGRGRWIRAWVHWGIPSDPSHSMSGVADARFVCRIETDGHFRKRLWAAGERPRRKAHARKGGVTGGPARPRASREETGP